MLQLRKRFPAYISSSLLDPWSHPANLIAGRRALRTEPPTLCCKRATRGETSLGSLVQVSHSGVTSMLELCCWNVLRDCVGIAADWSTAHASEHHVSWCHAQLWIQLPVKGEASSSIASIHAENPQLQFKQKSAVGYLQEPGSATACQEPWWDW